MKVLLDTHALLWALEGNPRLSARAVEVIGDPRSEKLVSAVSAYEICLKNARGRLPGADALAANFAAEIGRVDCIPLALTLAHADRAGKLDMAHKDPFDRMLIAQALEEGVALVSNEALFDRYGVERIW